MNKKMGLVLCITGIILIGIGIFLEIMKKENQIVISNNEEEIVNTDYILNNSLIKKIHKHENYLISPYSISIALNMLRDGSNNQSREQIDNVLQNKKINDLSIENKLNIANGLFVKNDYKNLVLNSYYNKIKKDYHGDIVYDDFQTPEVINSWVSEKTKGMIPGLLQTVPPRFVLAIVNALALDIKWQDKFDCESTRSEPFTKMDGSKIDVEMMHASYAFSDYKYINEDDLKGIILPYEKIEGNNTQLEFIGLMPKDIDNYISNLKEKELMDIDKKSKEASDDIHVHLSLPRFTYDYNFEDFKNALIDMGITDVFDEKKANLSNIIPKEKLENNIYISDAIHKTKIELSETGTKAAAVTAFIISEASGIPKKYDFVSIEFNRPFIYIIRDKITKEIIFFGAVYEPNIWQGSTCTEGGY